MRTINTYDEGILVKERAIQQRKRELMDSYETLVADIDDLLGKAAESSATMAERSFESKRRDFQRFLERAERNYTQVATTNEEAVALFQQFLRFVQRWLVVFAECSVDPIHSPKIVVSNEELAACNTIGEVANLTLERLKQTEVRFISSQRDKDAKVLRGIRAEARRLSMRSASPQSVLAELPGGGGSSSSMAGVEIELTSARSWVSTAPPQLGGESTAHQPSSFCVNEPISVTTPQAPQDTSSTAATGTQCAGCTWLQIGGDFNCGISRNTGNGFPCVVSCKCMRFALLSRDHAWLFLGCFVAGFLLIVAVPSILVRPIMFLMVIVYFPCLLVLLVQFEHMDVIQRLEREVSELEAESSRIMERRERMMKFWSDMQQLTDIWVHRTVPRLDLLKEVQSLLEFTEPEDLLPLMAGANTRLEALEKALPELSYWRNDGGGLSEDQKKAFANKVLKLCQEDSLPRIMTALNQIIEDGLPRPSISTGSALLDNNVQAAGLAVESG